ncbi:hypothetical protein DPX16_19820 [Anabarilius grahami]|uniref:Uncharacterized protein n=1 Tax=Anabarilius grahami TaxID=495550 RepID=A0A3N0Y7H3_ANAGA|nr:hypothetical protein DPX16_19820 [Anabarilius grahami]
MDYADSFCVFTTKFISVALACPYDDETLKSLFWIGANYHRPVDLTKSGECLSPIQSTARPRAHIFSTDRGILVRAPRRRRVTTSSYRSARSQDPEDRDPLPTLSTPRSASPPVPSLLDIICPASSPGNPCDVDPQVTLPPAALRPEVPVASPPAADLVAPSWPVDLPAPFRLRPSTVPPETLRLTAPPVSLVRPAPPCYRGLLLPLGVASVLGRADVTAALGISSSTSAGRRQYIAAVSQASDVEGVRQLSVYASESTCRVSVGHPPDAVSPLYIISPFINSAVDCRIWGALGLRQWSTTINAAGGSSSSLPHSVTITPSTSGDNVTFTVSSCLLLTVTCSFVFCSHSCSSLVLCI